MTADVAVNETTSDDVVTESEVTEAPLPEVDSLGEFASLVVTKANLKMAELKEVSAKLQAAGNIGDLLSEAIKTSQDPRVIENLKKIEKANEALIAWAKENEAIVKPTLSVPSDEEMTALETAYKGFVSNVKTLDTVFTSEVSGTYPNLTLYDYVGEMPKGRKGSTGAKAGQGEGQSRPRVSEIAVSVDNGEIYKKVENKEGKSTFSVLTQWLKKETGETIGATDLHEEWFKQNGNVTDWSALNEQTTFNYPLKGKNFFIRVTK